MDRRYGLNDGMRVDPELPLSPGGCNGSALRDPLPSAIYAFGANSPFSELRDFGIKMLPLPALLFHASFAIWNMLGGLYRVNG